VLAFAPLDAAVSVAYDLVFGLADLLGPALAVVAATAALRLLLLPLTFRQVRAERARAALAPDLAKLREQHRGDAATLARETMALHRSAGVGMFAGLLPALVQAPFFLVLYRLFASPSVPGALFGAPLGSGWAAGGLFGPHDVVFWILLGALAGLAWWSSRRLRGGPPLLRILPYFTLVVAATAPLAAGLYLVTTTAWTAAENAALRPRPACALSPPTDASI
jgi:YidC/Oxa1 family membrane protein insertase